ncbi:MAG: protein translocase subunit SecDF, partial [Rikenellaceae bacterium]|nr:protein translocase subunit SecDF [Rikenellaceae bacterium]
MQNKGALRLLAIVLAIACAYQLSFTVVTRSVEKKAATYAQGDEAREASYLDSIKSETVYNLGLVKFSYKECKEREINLGLDLRGGMNVMLEISVEDVVRALANHNPDPAFNQALAQARKAQESSSRDYITLFREAYEQIVPGGRLSFIFNTPELREQVTPESTNEQVANVLRQQSESAIANSFNVLRNRIDRFGVTQPNIQRLENSGRILVELPGVKEPERVRKLLQGTASLEFWATYDNAEIYPMFEQVNQYIKEYLSAAGTVAPADSTGTVAPLAEAAATVDSSLLAQLDPAQAAAETSSADLERDMPFFARLHPIVDYQSGRIGQGPVVGQAQSYDTATVNRYLALPQAKALLPRDVQFMWGVKATDNAGVYFDLYAIRKNTRDGRAPLDGGVVVDAREEYAQQGAAAEVSMAMNAEGSRVWARMTADNIGKSIAICLDGYVYSAPRVNSEISGGRSQITGQFTINEARDLANVLKSGKLPAPARIIQEAIVGPSLGQESIDAGMMSFVLAFLLVLFYMILFYNKAGMVASIALITNLFFLFGVLVSFGAVLTLPGIAGIVLTMGMAVDANVIIYERIKEELKAGKGVSLALKDGFSNAYSAIIDGNMTTMITGIVLFIFGTGPVQGFATTLIIGIITSLFSAIFITRLIFVAILGSGKKIRFSNKYTENFLSNTKFDFIKIRKYTYMLSIALMVITFVSLATRGMNYGVDFSGGRAFVVRFDQPVTDNQVRDRLSGVFGVDESFEVKQYGVSGEQKRIVTQYKYDDAGENVTDEIFQMLYDALASLNAEPLTFDEFSTTATNPIGIISADKIGPSVASDIKRDSIIALVFSLLA